MTENASSKSLAPSGSIEKMRGFLYAGEESWKKCGLSALNAGSCFTHFLTIFVKSVI